MSNADPIPNTSHDDLITYDLVVNGTAVDSGYQVISIAVTKEVNRIPMSSIVLRDGEAARREFAVSNTKDFTPGNKIQISLGRDGKNTQVFKGLIVKHRVRVREKGISELVVECKDESVRMSVGRHSRYFENIKDSEVMEQIIRGYSGLTPDVDALSLKHEELVQYHCTDWDFVLSRAEVNGRLVFIDDGKVQIKKPNTEATPALQVSYGVSLLEFEAEMDARTQWKAVEAQAWDYTNQRMFQHTSDTLTLTEPGNIKGSDLAEATNPAKVEFRHGGQLNESELQQWTDSALLKSRLAKICGRAKFHGFPGIKPGDVIELQGVGDRFNGNAFVSSVRHALGNGAWDTHVQFGLVPEWFNQSQEILDKPAAGLVPAIHGLQIGKVVQLQDDPDGEHRILVRLPIIDNSARGIWARIASLDAGNNRGAFFRPEIDDEVIVGFVNDDPRDAIVLGMLNSSAKPAPITAKDINDEKGFVTRSKMRVVFDDGTKKITIDTPTGNSIVLDEESTSIVITDQNKNTLKLEPSGITLDSPKNITVKAGGKIDITATTELNLSGLQMTASATGAAKVNGATVDVTGSGPTTIKGMPIQIN
jgi:Rhs element Vgr protein